MNLKCIVTGTGRNGSVFMARLLTSLGMPCGHESIFDWGDEESIRKRLLNPQQRVLSHCSTFDLKNQTQIEPWVDPAAIVAESSYLAVPCLHWLKLSKTPIIHIVRDPFKVVTSFINDFKYFEFNYPNKENFYNEKGWENRIYEFLPLLHKITTPIERACYFYVQWNKIIEKTQKNRPYFFSRIESINVEKLCDFLNLPYNPNHFKNTTINTKRDMDHTFQPNLGRPSEFVEELYEIRKRYGY